jgi:UDP:flavonoid glycosyltransferase YjiC (YdhE family)
LRILFAFAGGSGHLDPLVPLARAAEQAGHTVAFAGRPLMTGRVEKLGFTAFATGTDRGLTPVRRPLLPVDRERELRDFREGFAGRIAGERAPALVALCQTWRPDLIVWEETDFGAVLAAEYLGLPHATVLVIAAGSFVPLAAVGEVLNAHRAAYGLAADPEMAMLSRYLVLAPMPPGYRDPAFPLPATAHSVRLTAGGGEQQTSAPPWEATLADAPTVYFTLGTVFNVESGDLFERVLVGLRGLPVHLVVTVGWGIEPAELGPQPPNVQIFQHIPQEITLRYCDVVISHAGSGSVMGALGYGRPMVLLPMGADQPWNADRCEAWGVARVLDPVAVRPEEVGEAVMAVLTTTSYREAAERLRDGMVAMPGPEYGVRLLEGLVGV